ncbi:hypothetical protein AT15_09095 [Kosmotoga arenicorallina S304]|uniref:Uncharacterized protein n=1 Tax=Kosmotoga arenicorallina S304 TaxID=1453497 RepID=A0A176K1Q7_9BACT|nr:hypothetical protein [Kosmotoga arenicorallina]OAA30829.1 hypothetical protein AT15_09095 [Kosmotoga arenicorallina S304]
MTIAELLVYLLVFSLSIAVFTVATTLLAENFRIRAAKFKIDAFLEKIRQSAIVESRRIKLYYSNRKIIASTGEFIDKLPFNRNELLIAGFTEKGSFFVELGSTIFTFTDGSTMSILPVTGNLSY